MFGVRRRHLPYKLTYSAAAAAGALAIASTISGGKPKRTFSGMTSSSLTLSNPLVPKKFTTSSTRHSGAEAPAVKAMVFTPSSHSDLTLRKLSIRCELDRKSTRLNSSHGYISYAVFCLKKKKNIISYQCTHSH